MASPDRRAERVSAGLDALDTWVRDQVRDGLAGLERAGSAPWRQQAARLVDAQAPSLARRVEGLAEIPGASDGWPDALVDALGGVSLLVAAWRRIDALPPELAASVRTHLGWRTKQADVLAEGPRVRDVFVVAGQVTTEDDDLSSRRTWLVGASATALLLEFVYGYGEFERGLAPGTALDATVAYYPGAVRQRAVLAARHGPADAPPRAGTVAGVLDALATALAADPWTARVAGYVRDGAVGQDAAGFFVTDATGTLPLAGEPWGLLALSGGRPIDLFVEWTGHRATALAAWVGDRLEAVT